MEWELFKIWAKLDGYELDMASWREVESLSRVFENERKQNSFNYQRALCELNQTKF